MTTAPAAPPAKRKLPAGGGIKIDYQEYALFGVVILLIIAGWIWQGESFMSKDNIFNVLRQGSVVGVLAIGMTFVIATAGIDLSVGSMVAATAIAGGWLMEHIGILDSNPTLWFVLGSVAFGFLLGSINGLAVSYGKVVPFIATLAMLAGARGLAELIAQKRTQIVTVTEFKDFFGGDVLGVPVLVIIFVVVSVVGWVVLNRTTFGRRTFAVGGNPEAARLAGIDVRRHTVLLYVVVGLCCGIAAVMITARTGTGSSTHGLLYELDAIAAVVIGGTLLTGGRGTITGTVLGVLIFTTLQNVFTQNNLSSSAQSVAKGLIIVVAVLLQQRLARRSDAGG